MALTFTRVATFVDTTDQSSYATTSWTPSANTPYLAAVSCRDETDPFNPDVPDSVTGNSLTWVQIGTVIDAATRVRTTLFYAAGVASPAAGATTAAFPDNQEACVIHIDEIGGGLTSGVPVDTANQQSAVGSGVTSLAT